MENDHGKKVEISDDLFSFLKDPTTGRLSKKQVRECLINAAREDVMERHYTFDNINPDVVNELAEAIVEKYKAANPDIDEEAIRQNILNDYYEAEFGFNLDEA